MEIECPKCHATIRTTIFDHEETTSQNTVRGTDHGSEHGSERGFSGLIQCPNCGETFQHVVDDVNEASVLTVAAESNEASRMFSHFELIRVLGRGGFGTVWLAHDRRLHRHVALKLPTSRQGRVDSMLKEARTAAKLQHPNVVAIHEVGEHEGQAFIVSDYVDGTDMQKYLRNGVPPIEQTVSMLQAIAAGLQHAHDHQIVHRDIKPANVLVRWDGTPLLTDFGLAKKIDVDESISSKGKVVGTYIYMSPEQAGYAGRVVSYPSDIYSLGVMMYEMLTGERPFRGELPAIIDQKVNGEPVPLRSLRASIPIDLETICLKCMRLQPERRYQSANEFCEELERFRTGRPILARPTSKLHHAWRWCQRNPLVATLLTLLFLSLATGLTGTSLFWKHAVDQTAEVQRSLYNSKMQLAGNYFQTGEIESVRDSLVDLTDASMAEYVSFEARFLESQLQRFKNVVHHAQLVSSVAISRDGEWFVSVSNDRRLVVWNDQSNTPTREIEAKIGRWLSVDVSRRDNRVAAGAKDGSVYVWRTIHDTSLQPQTTKHGVSVEHVKFSGDGLRLFTAGAKGAIRVWDAETLELIQELPSGQNGVVSLDVSRDGKVLAIAGNEGAVRVWDVDNRGLLCNISSGFRLESIAIAPDASRIVLGSYTGFLIAYDVASSHRLFEIDTDYDFISSIEFMANTPLICLCSSNGTVVVFDIDRQCEVSEHMTHFYAGGTLDVTANGVAVVVGSLDGTVKLLRMDDFRRSTVLSEAKTVSDLRAINDSTVLVSYQDGSVLMHNFNTRDQVMIREPASDVVPAIAVSRVKQWLAYQSSPGAITIADAHGAQIATIALEATGPMRMCEADQVGKLVVIDSHGNMNLYQVDPHHSPIVKSEFAKPIHVGQAAVQLCVNDRATHVVAVTANNEVCLCDTTEQTFSKIPVGIDAPISCVAFFGPDLLIGSSDGYLQRMDTTSFEPAWRMKAHIGSVSQLRVLNDQRAFVSVGRDSQMSFWDISDGSVRMRLHHNRLRLVSVDVLNDDSCIATATSNGQIRLWSSVSNMAQEPNP